MAINQLKLIGKTSGEVFVLRYPSTLLDFIGFDFSVFAKGAVDLCNEALKSGMPDYDRIAELRRDIQPAHCYIENNIRTVYEKIVFDCWIDYVCRRDNIGESGLWNRLIRCRTAFDKAVFARLSEFRYNRAANEWLNIIRIQDYAKTKVEFVFGKELSSVEEAAARRNYFDLMFSVTAREMGCRLEDLGVTKVFSVGRVPPAPFLFPNISKEIMRHVLTNFDYSDDYSDIGDYSESSDQIAMDAFSKMKAGLPRELSDYNISSNIPDKENGTIYMPCSLKAAIDLEIDAIIEDGAWLARCKKCQRFFLRSKEHPEEYCSRYVHGGKTCLQQYEDENPRPTMTPELEERCRAVTDEVYARVDKTMSVKEYDYWHLYLEAMIDKVKNGEILPQELENFLDYSLEVDISKSRPIVEVAKREPETTSHERVVKPFVPERISRSDIQAVSEPVFDEPEPMPVSKPKEGFFTSPSVQRQKNERPQISHIIRNGESLGENTYSRKPDPAGFRSFGEPPAPPAPMQPVSTVQEVDLPQFGKAPTEERSPRQDIPQNPQPRRFSTYEKLNILEDRIGEENRIRREMTERSRQTGQRAFSELGERPETHEPREPRRVDRESVGQREENVFRYDFEEQNPQRRAAVEERETYEPRDEGYREEKEERSAPPRAGSEEPPRAKVIRKNAAAISAYGKAAGTAFTTADPLERPREERKPEEPKPEADPFKDIGSIFDVLEQSESQSQPRSHSYAEFDDFGSDSENSYRPRGRQQTPTYDERSEQNYDREPEKFYGRENERAYDRAREPVYDREREPVYDREREPVYDRETEPAYDRESEPRVLPDHVTGENAPSGFWTEERNLFPENRVEQQAEDLHEEDRAQQAPTEPVREDTARSKSHKSTKTQRLFDIIMREPDDNPNVRK